MDSTLNLNIISNLFNLPGNTIHFKTQIVQCSFSNPTCVTGLFLSNNIVFILYSFSGNEQFCNIGLSK